MSFSTGCRKCEKCGKMYLMSLFDSGLCAECEKAEQEPCDDAVSRQAIQELPKHLMKTEGMPFPKSEYFVKLDDLMRLQSVQPCEDAVSRAELLNKSWEVEFNGEYIQVVDVGDILDAPPVHPKQKTGHWKRISIDKYSEHAMYWYRCDRCGKDNLGNKDWCPNCGTKMVEPQESEVRNEVIQRGKKDMQGV